MDIGIPAQTMYVVVFTATGYVALCGCIHILFMTGVEPAPPDAKPWQKIAKNEQFWCRLILVILGSVVGVNQIETTCGRNEAENKCDHWHVMFWYTLFLIVTASISTTPYEFYLGEGINFVDTMKHYLLGKTLPDPQELEDQIKKKYSVGGSDLQGIGFWTLMPSAFISWIFAKSIRKLFSSRRSFWHDGWFCLHIVVFEFLLDCHSVLYIEDQIQFQIPAYSDLQVLRPTSSFPLSVVLALPFVQRGVE